LAIKNIINQTNKRIAVVASGDLSHRLTKDAPAGYSPIGKEFDKKIIKLLKEKKIKEILNLDPKFVDQAGECGFRSILILLGVFKDINFDFDVLSYQGPFGIGYLVANFKIA
jgi:AmmeMemoRadiSam system protein B